MAAFVVARDPNNCSIKVSKLKTLRNQVLTSNSNNKTYLLGRIDRALSKVSKDCNGKIGTFVDVLDFMAVKGV